MPLTEGDKAPDFSVPASTGKTISLKALRGSQIVLYFYPKDNTPGCTTEACSFRDLNDDIQTAGAIVLGVSTDSLKSHTNFANKHNLPFPLLADTEKDVATKYEAWGEKKLYGRTYMGITRKTYLIDAQGLIKRIWPKVKVAGHAEEVLSAIHT